MLPALLTQSECASHRSIRDCSADIKLTIYDTIYATNVTYFYSLGATGARFVSHRAPVYLVYHKTLVVSAPCCSRPRSLSHIHGCSRWACSSSRHIGCSSCCQPGRRSRLMRRRSRPPCRRAGVAAPARQDRTALDASAACAGFAPALGRRCAGVAPALRRTPDCAARAAPRFELGSSRSRAHRFNRSATAAINAASGARANLIHADYLLPFP